MFTKASFLVLSSSLLIAVKAQCPEGYEPAPDTGVAALSTSSGPASSSGEGQMFQIQSNKTQGCFEVDSDGQVNIKLATCDPANKLQHFSFNTTLSHSDTSKLPIEGSIINHETSKCLTVDTFEDGSALKVGDCEFISLPSGGSGNGNIAAKQDWWFSLNNDISLMNRATPINSGNCIDISSTSSSSSSSPSLTTASSFATSFTSSSAAASASQSSSTDSSDSSALSSRDTTSTANGDEGGLVINACGGDGSSQKFTLIPVS